MGSGRFDSNAYSTFTSNTRSMGRDEIFKERKLRKELDPLGVKLRESRDSADNPKSNAIIVAVDVTGSMGILAETIARQGLGVLFNRIFDEDVVTDPHVMFMGIGDCYCDQAPLQVSQFEADNRIVEQLTQLWLEGGGGGNNHESYHMPWYFAAKHTSIDCFEKRGRKGYLFTLGDEEAPGPLYATDIVKFIGTTGYASEEQGNKLSPHQLLKMAQEQYHVFHIIIEEGSYAKRALKAVQESWQTLMGENVLSLKDHTKLADGIVAIIKANEENLGRSKSVRPASLPPYLGLLRDGV